MEKTGFPTRIELSDHPAKSPISELRRARMGLCDFRDLFFELVREWEDCRTKPGWSVEESMGTRIRYV